MLCGILLIGQFFALHDYFDTSGGITERFHSGAKFGGKKVAILAVQGVIVESDGFVKRQIDRIRADQDVRAIVLRVDSPGGAVTASDYLYHHLKKLRQERKIPLVVSMGGMATSGGYYVAMAVGDQKDSIFAEPTTTTGSIGVIIPHFDLSGLLARFDIKDDSIATHPRKEMLSMTKPITDEQRRLLQTHIDDSFQRFKEVVRDGRPRLSPAARGVGRVGDGRDLHRQPGVGERPDRQDRVPRRRPRPRHGAGRFGQAGDADRQLPAARRLAGAGRVRSNPANHGRSPLAAGAWRAKGVLLDCDSGAPCGEQPDIALMEGLFERIAKPFRRPSVSRFGGVKDPAEHSSAGS